MSATTKRGAPIDHVVAVDEDEGGFTLSMDDGTTQRIPMRATNARTQTWLRALRAHRASQERKGGGQQESAKSERPVQVSQKRSGAPIDHVVAVDEDEGGFTLSMDDGTTQRIPLRATNAQTQTWLRALRAHKATRASEQQEEELRGPQQFATGGLVPHASLPFTPAVPPMSVDPMPPEPRPTEANTGISDIASRYAIGSQRTASESVSLPPISEPLKMIGLLPKDWEFSRTPVGRGTSNLQDAASVIRDGVPIAAPGFARSILTRGVPATLAKMAGNVFSRNTGPGTTAVPPSADDHTDPTNQPTSQAEEQHWDPDPTGATPVPIGPALTMQTPPPPVQQTSPIVAVPPALGAGDGGPQDEPTPSPSSRFEAAVAEERAANQKLGQIQSLQQQSIAQERGHTQDSVRRLHERRDQLLKDHNRQWELQRQKVAAGEINPRRFWTDQSIPAKISTAIGLFLGGLGAGMTRSPNHALQLFQKFIDDDINAQREALARDERMLDTLRQQGLDIESYFARREAERLAALAGELEFKAAQFASREAIENAKLIAAQLEQRAITIGQQIAEREAEAEFQQQMRPLEIAGAVSDLQTASVQRQAARHRMRMEQQQLAAGTEAERQKAIILDQFINQGLPTDERGRAAYRLLPKEDRDVAVIVGDRYVPAISKAAADKQRENEEFYKPMLKVLNQMDAFRKKYPNGQWWGRFGDAKAHGEMEILHNRLVAAYVKMDQGSRPSDFDWQVIKDMIPDLRKWSPTQAYDGRLDQLRSTFLSQIDAQRRSNLLFVPGAAQPFSFREDRSGI